MRSACLAILLLAAACADDGSASLPGYTAGYVLLNGDAFLLRLDDAPVEPEFELTAVTQDALRRQAHVLAVEDAVSGLVRTLALVPACPSTMEGELVLREQTTIYVDPPRGGPFTVVELTCESVNHGQTTFD